MTEYNKCTICGSTNKGYGQFGLASFTMRDNMCNMCCEDLYADYDEHEQDDYDDQ